MSLSYCPECSHEVSANAVACPNCGRPISAPPVVERKVVVMPPVERESEFPTWAFIPIGLLAAILVVVVYMAFRQSEDQANMNVNVNMAGRRASTEANRDTRAPSVPSTSNPTVAVPPGQTTTVPGTTTAAPVAPPSDKGTVVINAQINATDGGPQAARNTKFYLLDKDVETVLSEARIEPIEGNTLTGSLGLAAVYPDRYGDFQRNAMRAIAAYSKYSGTTGGSGSASLAGIAPNQYYLFAVTRVKNGFALWNSPVSVVPGENVLNLSPQSVTEIPDAQ
jgi:zinc-ribbon domain